MKLLMIVSVLTLMFTGSSCTSGNETGFDQFVNQFAVQSLPWKVENKPSGPQLKPDNEAVPEAIFSTTNGEDSKVYALGRILEDQENIHLVVLYEYVEGTEVYLQTFSPEGKQINESLIGSVDNGDFTEVTIFSNACIESKGSYISFDEHDEPVDIKSETSYQIAPDGSLTEGPCPK